MKGDYIFGSALCVANFYLFVMILWARDKSIEVPLRLTNFRYRMMQLPPVRTAMGEEGLISKGGTSERVISLYVT